MRLLNDEGVDERLRFLFPGHNCQTARFANLAGLKNRRLLEAAKPLALIFSSLWTKTISGLQNLPRRRISLVILCGSTNRLRDLELLVPTAVSALMSIRPGDVAITRSSLERIQRHTGRRLRRFRRLGAHQLLGFRVHHTIEDA
jgi:hypothetical protein